MNRRSGEGESLIGRGGGGGALSGSSPLCFVRPASLFFFSSFFFINHSFLFLVFKKNGRGEEPQGKTEESDTGRRKIQEK